MIILHKPVLRLTENTAIISVVFEQKGENKKLWYSIPREYEKFIVTENLDGFLVGLLSLGLEHGEDIKLKAPISARLFYTIKHYLIDALCLANPKFKKINILPESLSTTDLNIKEVAATGLSCGVDSFATYFDHKEEEKPFKIEYFTFFNVGSHGDFGGEKARKTFYQRLNGVKAFSQKEEVELIAIDSNLSEILRQNFQETHSLRSTSCVLLLQKLFRNYYYASSLRFDRFKLDKVRIAEYDLLNLQMLSTESVNLFSSVSQLTRIERIELIAKYKETYNLLDVCTNSKHGNRKNCSECNKCLRTLMTLDFLGHLENYKEVFDFSKYLRKKWGFLGQLYFKSGKETLDYELLELIKSNKIKMPVESYYFGMKIIWKQNKKKLKEVFN